MKVKVKKSIVWNKSVWPVDAIIPDMPDKEAKSRIDKGEVEAVVSTPANKPEDKK